LVLKNADYLPFNIFFTHEQRVQDWLSVSLSELPEKLSLENYLKKLLGDQVSGSFIPKLTLSRGIKELNHLHLKQIGLDLSLKNPGISKVI
jgi:hypothetical protein